MYKKRGDQDDLFGAPKKFLQQRKTKEVLPLESETHLLDEINRETKDKQHRNHGGANSHVVSKQEDGGSDVDDFVDVLSKEESAKNLEEVRKMEEGIRRHFARWKAEHENDLSEVLLLESETHLLDENYGEKTEKQQRNLGGANSLVVSTQEDEDSDLDDFFEVMSKEQTEKYLEELRKNEEEEKRPFERRKTKYENEISEILPLERESRLLDENTRETREKQHRNLGGANSLVVSKQEDGDSYSDDFVDVLSKEESAKNLQEVRKMEEGIRKHFERWKAEHENDLSEVLLLESETHLLDEKYGETTEKQQGNLGSTNSLDVLKQEIPRKDDVIFSFDPMNTYSSLLINCVNKENVNTLLKDIVNELTGTKKKMMDDSSYMVNVEGISSDSASNYCILRNTDTDYFNHSNSETAIKLQRFYTKVQQFTNCPFERIIEYWEDPGEIQLMDEDNKNINDNETDSVGLDCEILNRNLGEKHIDDEVKTIGKKISGDIKSEKMNITKGETLKEIQDTNAVSGLCQLQKSNKSDYVNESVTQYSKMRDAVENAKVIL